jgi:16S rRNA (guanine527-N7)-methyltransferase
MSIAEALLEEGIGALRLALPAGGKEQLLRYMALLEKWNRVYNLTAIRERRKLVTHHLLDSLAVVPHLSGRSILDVGTGAGLPGIPLAIARPDWAITLLDSNLKKTAFVTQAIGELQLANAQVSRERVESWQSDQRFGVVISRAFADLADFVRLAGHLVAPEGRLVAMKGLHPFEEIAQLPASFRVDAVIRLEVPGLEGERHLVILARSEAG